MERSSNCEATTAIIVAHPGHELLLHHWLEIDRPIVFALTDGSGGHGEDRRAMSLRIIEAAGASVGPVFGLAPDKDWYAAILAGEYSLFDQASSLIAAACRSAGVRRIVTDSIEFYNPMHDLCNAVAAGIVRNLREGGATDVELFDYAIEYPNLRNGPAAMELSLTDEALRRKQSAIASYCRSRQRPIGTPGPFGTMRAKNSTHSTRGTSGRSSLRESPFTSNSAGDGSRMASIDSLSPITHMFARWRWR